MEKIKSFHVYNPLNCDSVIYNHISINTSTYSYLYPPLYIYTYKRKCQHEAQVMEHERIHQVCVIIYGWVLILW